MYLLNVPWSEAVTAGGLFGEKVVLNEFVAFIHLGTLDKELSGHTVGVVTFALCGFANFSSIAIQMAVTGNLAPNQRPLIAKLGLRALLAGSLANLMSAGDGELAARLKKPTVLSSQDTARNAVRRPSGAALPAHGYKRG